MKPPLLVVDNLQVAIRLPKKAIEILKGISFSMEAGECRVVIGESGSGKTTLAMAMIGSLLLDPHYHVSGRSEFLGKNLLVKKEKTFRERMGKEIGVIVQDPSQALHPLYTIGQQMEEMLFAHKEGHFLSESDRREAIQESLARVELSPAIMKRYPHEISGGQKQRAMIAMATLLQPKLLVCDEPTAALDPTVQNEILRLLLSIKRNEGTALFFITHDLKAARALGDEGDEIMVMYQGEIVEMCLKAQLESPNHPYTKHLLSCSPENIRKGKYGKS